MAENDAAAAGEGQDTGAAPPPDASAPPPAGTDTGAADKTRGADGKFTAKAAEPPAWGDIVKGIGDEKIRGHLERFTSLEEAGKGLLSLRQQISTAREGWVRPPYEGMPEEEKKAWHKATGIPDEPAAYGIAPPEGADDATKDRYGKALAAFHEVGAPRSVVELAFKMHEDLGKEASAAAAAAFDAEVQKAGADLKQEWGSDYQRNEGLAQRAISHLAPEMVELLKNFELDQHPAVLKTFARIGAKMAEDVPAIAADRATIESSFDAIDKEYAERMEKGTQFDEDFQRRLRESYVRRYGTKAA